MLPPDILWLARELAGMCADIDTLRQKVSAQLNHAPHGGAAFVLTNRACTRRLHRG